MLYLPNSFTQSIKLIYGYDGEKWLRDLPAMIASLARKWDIEDIEGCADLSYNYVAKGTQRNAPVVLKLGYDNDAMTREYYACQAFKGHGVVELLDADLHSNALLMQAAVPGTSLVALFPHKDLQALQIAKIVLDDLHQANIPQNATFPTLTDWLQILDVNWDLPQSQLHQARQLRNEVLKHYTTPVLLHGDMHYSNILSQADTWLAIDPKGVIGASLYDYTGALLREPIALVMQSNAPQILVAQRISTMAQLLDQDPRLIWAWTYVQTVMSICWCIEDNQEIAQRLQFLMILETIGKI